MAAKEVARVGSKLSVNFLTNIQKLHLGIWPWTVGLKSRLPYHFKVRYVERFMNDPTPVHYRYDTRKYVADKFGMPTRIQNTLIPITFPAESNEGLWGGEGYIVGMRKRHNDRMKPSIAKIWKPTLLSRVLYSEILDKWLELTVTPRTLELIDQAAGFDFYILKTSEIDLQSRLGMTLKREMLLALARKSMYPDNPEKQNCLYDKYKQFVIPAEEAEWVGLSLHEAERKQHEIEEAERISSTKPLKVNYLDELSQKLSELGSKDTSTEEQSWLKKFSPFQKTQDSDK